MLTLQSLQCVDLFEPVIFDSSRTGLYTVAKTPLHDFWTKRGGAQVFDMGGSMVIYGTLTMRMAKLVR